MANPDEDADLALARELQAQFDNEVAAAGGGGAATATVTVSSDTDGDGNGADGDAATDADAELAKKLQEEAYSIDADAELAKALAAELNAPVAPPQPSSGAGFFNSLINGGGGAGGGGGGHRRYGIEKDTQPPNKKAIKRMQSDLTALYRSANPLIFSHSNEDDLLDLQVILVGPEDTPYEGGLFHFQLYFPHDYPWNPPKVELITTDAGQVRFNPNLYADGKVCLSIIGTWSGPAWQPIQTIESVLLSVQSLMCEQPYHNEPGFDSERRGGDSQRFNDIIQHETIRVAVCGMMENATCGDLFRVEMENAFMERYDRYVAICEGNRDKDGRAFEDPHGSNTGAFDFASLLTRLAAIRERLLNAGWTQPDPASSTAMGGGSTSGPGSSSDSSSSSSSSSS